MRWCAEASYIWIANSGEGTVSKLCTLDGVEVGCVALVDNLRYGEIKRLFVHGSVRGAGLGRALMAALEDLARDIGLKVLRLETGPELAEAVQLYDRLGYHKRERFGGYEDLPCSLFMEKSLL